MKITAIAILALSVMPLAGQGLPVTYERLVKADQEPGNWLTYSNSYNSWRFSRLDQINTQNVKNLRSNGCFKHAARRSSRPRRWWWTASCTSPAGKRRVCARCRNRPRPVDLQL